MPDPSPDDAPLTGRAALLGRQPWLAFVLPMATFVLAGQLETAAGDALYPAAYAAKTALLAVAVWFVWPALRAFPLRIGWLAVAVGAAGAVLWIGVCESDIGLRALAAVGLPDWSGGRAGYNPFEWLAGDRAAIAAFLAVRLLGLAALVPIAEELFLRGFLMRFVSRADWDRAPFGALDRRALAASLIYPVLSHPAGEWLAAVLWFALVTWLMVRTRNLWDCVAAHAVTNLLLGVYAATFSAWHLL